MKQHLEWRTTDGVVTLAPGLLAPRAFTFAVTGLDDPPFDVTLRVRCRAARFEIVALTFHARTGSVTSEGLRAVPVARLLRAALNEAIATVNGKGAPVSPARCTELGRAGPTRETLKAVRLVYRIGELVGTPAQVVAEWFDRPIGTANRWVALAQAGRSSSDAR